MNSNIQVDFFKYISKRKSKEETLSTVMDTLHIQKGAAYKRINGTTLLSAEEMVKICNKFGFSLDTVTGSDQFMSFEHPFLGEESSIDFLDRYAFYLKPLMDSSSESTLTYMANELPIFYYFSHRYIFNFLLAVWNHLHWDEAQLNIKENVSIEPQLENLRNEVSTYYDSHPVTEIWNSNMLSNLYQQILFAITIRAFENKRFVYSLIKDIEKLLSRLHELAGSGMKSGQQESNIKIYLNEFGNYQNLALYKSEKLSVTFVGFDMPHFVVSYNQKFQEYSTSWIDKIKKRSILISSEGYQFRELFFLKMNKDFEYFKNRVDKLISVYYEE